MNTITAAIHLIGNMQITALLLPVGIVAILVFISHLANRYIQLDELHIDKNNTTTTHEFKIETVKNTSFPFNEDDLIAQPVKTSNNHPQNN